MPVSWPMGVFLKTWPDLNILFLSCISCSFVASIYVRTGYRALQGFLAEAEGQPILGLSLLGSELGSEGAMVTER